MSLLDLVPYLGSGATFELYINEGEVTAESFSQSRPFQGRDLSDNVNKVTIKAFINNGYMAKIQIYNPNFRVIDDLNVGGVRLLERLRASPVLVRFRLTQTPTEVFYPRAQTRWMFGYLAMIYPHGGSQNDYVEFIIIDPVNWAMRIGDACGGAFEGNITSVIKQIFDKYAPQVNLASIAESNDSPAVWWQMRRQPRDMLSHLLYLASSLSSEKTAWNIGIENNTAIVQPVNRFDNSLKGVYTPLSEEGFTTINSWEGVLNNSVGHTDMGIVTAGVTATLGDIYDKSNVPKRAIVDESNTRNKLRTANNGQANLATVRPRPDTFSAGEYGRKFIESPPEYFSDLAVDQQYIDYFDAYARTEYFRSQHKLFTLDVVIPGHGVWDTAMNLGADTVYLEWLNHFGDAQRQRPYFLQGNWICYGWEHTFVPGSWTTRLSLSKTDKNATGQPVGYTPENSSSRNSRNGS